MVRQTDGQTTNRGITVLCIASHGKKYLRVTVQCCTLSYFQFQVEANCQILFHIRVVKKLGTAFN